MQPTRIQLRHVLCPTDFSEFSARALRHAMAMARHFEARLTVLHAIQDPLAYGGVMPYGMASGPAAAAVRTQAAEELSRFVEPARLDRVPVSHEIRQGVPWREIRAMAEQLPADLVVMGTHGRGGFERFVLGSVAEQVMRTVACPVLTVCHEEGHTWAAPGLISRIVCATDLSESSQATIAFALSLAAERQAHVTFLHVIESLPEEGVSAYLATLTRNLSETLRHELHDAIPDEARAWCGVEERVEAGRAHSRILQLAVQDRADLIVIGGRGGRLLDGVLFGSTAQRVVREATCPVLSIRHSPAAGIAKKPAALAAAAAERPVVPQGGA